MGWWTEHCLHSLDELLFHLEICAFSSYYAHAAATNVELYKPPKDLHSYLQVTVKFDMKAEVVWLHVHALLKRTIYALFRILWNRIYDQSSTIGSDPHGMP